MERYAYYEYINFDGETFFTCVLLPKKEGHFPTVIMRSPYVQNTQNQKEDDIVSGYLEAYGTWLLRGYAIVLQHCRGQGKSSGAFIPYVVEREDGLALRRWIRKQSFYNGQLFLLGASYTASLHYATAPFEEDVLGAVFEVQDSQRYRLWYRNGQMRKGHANWHFALYKSKCGLNKNFNMASFSQLPLENLSVKALGEYAQDFEQMLTAPLPSSTFWNERNGGADTLGATDHANIPILLTTGYNDFYVGGIFKMWNRMDNATKSKSALLVSPYNHGDGYHQQNGLCFKNGKRAEQFGADYQIAWFDNIRTNAALPFKKGTVTYYRTFEDDWQSDFFSTPTHKLELPLGKDKATLCYNPLNPPAFCEEGTLQRDFSDREDVISLYTAPLKKDVFIKGQMKAVLTVSSSSADTSFYVNISIKKPQGDYTLRHDITSICHQLGNYTPNSIVTLNFCFDEYAFLLKKGECLRIDIASTDNNAYVCHTNKKGPYQLQNSTEIAINTIYLNRSKLIIPIE